MCDVTLGDIMPARQKSQQEGQRTPATPQWQLWHRRFWRRMRSMVSTDDARDLGT
jgi:hypothetical protein